MNSSPTEDEVVLINTEHDIDNPDRRELLRQLGGFAAYTAPTLLLLLTPRSAYSGSILDAPPGGPSF